MSPERRDLPEHPELILEGPLVSAIERTGLAWRRTSLAGTIVAGLAIKAMFGFGSTSARVMFLVAISALWAAQVLLGHWRLRSLEVRGQMEAGRAPIMLTGVVVLIAVCALTMAFQAR